MTHTHNLKKGPVVRRAGLISIYVRWVLLVAAVCTVRPEAAFGQRSLSSVLLPSDTTGGRKAARHKSGDFARGQLENERVIAARIDKRFEIKKLFRERGLPYPAEQIYLRVFKRERALELWVQPTGQDTFALLKTYNICALSNTPGPKRVQGDLQTPEGYYYIDNFNPQSGYHLSMRVNYPNEADRILGDGEPMGGDIYIHGGCKTAGCVAVTNENIKEIYWLAVEARDRGQSRIPVHIFPARMDDFSVNQLVRVFNAEPDLINFWANLKPGYDFFQDGHKLPSITVNKRGRYVYRKPAAEQLLSNSVVAVDTTARPVAAPSDSSSLR
jgi:murein L,D-transpeptidase YafK